MVFAEHERLCLCQLTAHIATKGKDTLFDAQLHLGSALAEIEFTHVDPDHVGGVGALEIIAPSRQVLHGPKDGA